MFSMIYFDILRINVDCRKKNYESQFGIKQYAVDTESTLLATE